MSRMFPPPLAVGTGFLWLLRSNHKSRYPGLQSLPLWAWWPHSPGRKCGWRPPGRSPRPQESASARQATQCRPPWGICPTQVLPGRHTAIKEIQPFNYIRSLTFTYIYVTIWSYLNEVTSQFLLALFSVVYILTKKKTLKTKRNSLENFFEQHMVPTLKYRKKQIKMHLLVAWR